MVRITGAGHVMRTLRNLTRKGTNSSVKVGYRTNYAVYVHENLQANHPNGGEAKFLENPARELRSQLVVQVQSDMRMGATLEQALYRAGLALQAASQQRVPVDTGALRSSAFTELVKSRFK